MAANPRRGEVAFRVGGETLVAVATLRNVAAMEAALGISGLSEFQARMENATTPDWLRVAEALTGREDIGDIALATDLGVIVEACMRALTFGAPEGNGGAAPAKARAARTSGASA